MPFKDIDYKKLAESNLNRGKLYQTVGVTNALREGDILKAELISGKELAPRLSAIDIFKQQEKQSPLIKAIKDIKPPSLSDIGNIIKLNVPAIEFPEDMQDMIALRQLPRIEEEPRIEEAKTSGNLDAGIDKDILDSYKDDDDVEKIMGEEKLYLPSELVAKHRNNIGYLKEYQGMLSELIKKLGRDKGTAKRQKKTDEYELLDKKGIALGKYNTRIKSIISQPEVLGMKGSGFKKLHYGKYLIDKPKLNKNVLSITYPNGKKVNGYPNMKVSDSVKKVLQNGKINKKYNLTTSEK
jgi:hypothetical protein